MKKLNLPMFFLSINLLAFSSVHAHNLCSITLGSNDELKFIQKLIEKEEPVTKYELVTDSKKFHETFEQFCEQNTKCDTLIISSHYDGIEFYGEDTKLKQKKHTTITKDELINYRSKNYCPGFFKAPKKVYLLGCNTLAKNNIYQRSPEQYAKDLKKAGMSDYDIQRIVAERFSKAFNFGILTYDLMRGIFPNSNISGYTDIGVSGPRVIPLIKNFNGTTEDLPAYLTKKVPGMTNALGFNKSIDESAKNKIDRIFLLHSANPGDDITSQLTLIKEIFNSEDVGTYLAEIESFLFLHQDYLANYQTSDSLTLQNILNYWTTIKKKNPPKDVYYLIGVRLSSIALLLDLPTSEFNEFRK